MRFRFGIILVLMLCLSGTAGADIAFPARLDVVESESGVYDISFTLPIIEGRKLRAEPQMPPSCSEITPRESGLSAGGHTSTWSVRCDPASLAGEAIIVGGLLGTQTDLAFALTTIEGRSYSQILRPSRPGFLVPLPPSAADLAAAAGLGGMRRVLRRLDLWLLLLVAVFSGARWRGVVTAAGALALGHFAGQWLGSAGWLEVTPRARDAFVWATIAVPAVRLAGVADGWRGWLRPLWPATLLVGLLMGGAQPEALSVEGLSSAEQIVALALFAVGVGAGAWLIAAGAFEGRAILSGTYDGRNLPGSTRVIGYAAGGIACGMFMLQLVSVATTIGSGPRAPLELVLLAAVLGPTLALIGRGGTSTVVPFLALAAFGVAPGLSRVPLPVASLWVLGSLIVLGGALALNRPLPLRWALVLTAIAVPAHAWSTAYALTENVSRSKAVTLGAILVAAYVLFASLALTRDRGAGGLPRSLRLLGATVAGLAIVWRLREYSSWFDREVATEAALGLARLPLVAIGLAALAVLLWPRRRRVARQLGLEQGPRRAHWFLLGAALLAVPYGSLAVRMPFFEPQAPRGEDARRVAVRVLSDTYHAFNIEDEGELYDTLAESVTGDLVDDLFLDSRRRLTAGTREGTQVTVRDVSVLEIGDPLSGATVEEGFSYDCRWAVIARVQHLQHVHHRRNLYNGVLTLRPDGGRWKIAGVELVSEDREVVPWKPT